jgi:transcription elongation factor GreA
MSGGQVWLAAGAHRRLRQELAELLRMRTQAGTGSGTDARDADPHTAQHVLTDRRERENRIRRLQEILLDPLVGHEPPDDGVAEPGMLLTVRYDVHETETFLLAQREDGAYPDVETCSPGSPLGRALVGRREGDVCRYRLPDGRPLQVTLVRAVPYGDR